MLSLCLRELGEAVTTLGLRSASGERREADQNRYYSHVQIQQNLTETGKLQDGDRVRPSCGLFFQTGSGPFRSEPTV